MAIVTLLLVFLSLIIQVLILYIILQDKSPKETLKDIVSIPTPARPARKPVVIMRSEAKEREIEDELSRSP